MSEQAGVLLRVVAEMLCIAAVPVVGVAPAGLRLATATPRRAHRTMERCLMPPRILLRSRPAPVAVHCFVSLPTSG